MKHIKKFETQIEEWSQQNGKKNIDIVHPDIIRNCKFIFICKGEDDYWDWMPFENELSCPYLEKCGHLFSGIIDCDDYEIAALKYNL